jgi:hypothetical protein
VLLLLLLVVVVAVFAGTQMCGMLGSFAAAPAKSCGSTQHSRAWWLLCGTRW